MALKDLVYTAGIIDGEGCLGLFKNHKGKYICYSPRILVTNTNTELIVWLQKTWGGSISKHIDKRGNRKTWYAWLICSADSRKLIPKLLPYLKVKRKQAKLLIEYFTLRDKHWVKTGRPSKTVHRRLYKNKLYKLYIKSRKYNKRGI